MNQLAPETTSPFSRFLTLPQELRDMVLIGATTHRAAVPLSDLQSSIMLESFSTLLTSSTDKILLEFPAELQPDHTIIPKLRTVCKQFRNDIDNLYSKGRCPTAKLHIVHRKLESTPREKVTFVWTQLPLAYGPCPPMNVNITLHLMEPACHFLIGASYISGFIVHFMGQEPFVDLHHSPWVTQNMPLEYKRLEDIRQLNIIFDSDVQDAVSQAGYTSQHYKWRLSLYPWFPYRNCTVSTTSALQRQPARQRIPFRFPRPWPGRSVDIRQQRLAHHGRRPSI